MNYPDLSVTVPIDHVAVEERVSRLNKRSIKKESKVQALKLALSMMDLTTLEGKDSEGKVIQLCQKAKLLMHPCLIYLQLPPFVCIRQW